jgi:hypothetical protein
MSASDGLLFRGFVQQLARNADAERLAGAREMAG